MVRVILALRKGAPNLLNRRLDASLGGPWRRSFLMRPWRKVDLPSRHSRYQLGTTF